MIHYDLRCDQGHAFDGWFRSSDDFENQSHRGLVSCPICGSSHIGRALMAPAIARPTTQASSEPTIDRETAMRAFSRHVMANTVDVGRDFARRAREIHESGSGDRIRGDPTRDEVERLHDDGIGVAPIPVFEDN